MDQVLYTVFLLGVVVVSYEIEDGLLGDGLAEFFVLELGEA